MSKPECRDHGEMEYRGSEIAPMKDPVYIGKPAEWDGGLDRYLCPVCGSVTLRYTE